MASNEHDGYDEEPEYEYIDAADLPTRTPKWVGWGIAGSLLLGAALGAGVVLVSGLTVEDLRGEQPVDASPVATTICSASANVRSTGSVTGDVVDTLNFGDEVDGMLSGAWLKLDEGRYVSVSVLCDLAEPVTQAGGDTEQATATAEPPTDTDQATATAGPDDAHIEGTFTASGTGNQTVELPADAQVGMLEFEHTGTGPMTITGTQNDGNQAPSPDLRLDGQTYGTTVFGLGTGVTELQVTTEGEWTLRVAPLDAVPEMTEAIGAPSMAAFYLGEDAGVWRFEPSSAMRITQYGADGSTASGEITGAARVEMQSGGSYVVVYTAGPWTADLVESTPTDDQAEVTSTP